MDEGTAVEQDLNCAAAWTIIHIHQLSERRTACYRAVCALSARMQPVSEHIRARQKGSVATVACQIHIGLLAAAVILLAWPDTKLPMRYVTGFSRLGNMEVTGVLRSIPYIAPVPVRELLQGSLAALEKLQAIVPEMDSA
eukprot:11630757-Heterocapsa_arctica.AAC.1